METSAVYGVVPIPCSQDGVDGVDAVDTVDEVDEVDEVDGRRGLIRSLG